MENFEKFLPEQKKYSIPVIATTTPPARPILLRNYKTIKEDKMPSELCLIEMAIVTATAPTFFKQLHLGGKTVADGGLSANCPLMVLLQDINVLQISDKEISGLLSIGTQRKTVKNQPKAVTPKELSSSSISSLLVDQTTDANGYTVDHYEEHCEMRNIPILRLCPQNIDADLNKLDDILLIRMLWNTHNYLFKNLEKIDIFAKNIERNLNMKSEPPSENIYMSD